MIAKFKKIIPISESVSSVLGKDGSLTYAYTKDGNDYFVSSDLFDDKEQGTPALLLVVRNKSKELVMKLPCLIVSQNNGFSASQIKKVRSNVWYDQVKSAYQYSPGFMRKFGKTRA